MDFVQSRKHERKKYKIGGVRKPTWIDQIRPGLFEEELIGILGIIHSCGKLTVLYDA